MSERFDLIGTDALGPCAAHEKGSALRPLQGTVSERFVGRAAEMWISDDEDMDKAGGV